MNADTPCTSCTPHSLLICNMLGYHGCMSERDPRIPDLVSKAQAAEILGISHQAVQQMVDKGRLKGAKVGATWVFRRVAVQAMRREPKEATS